MLSFNPGRYGAVESRCHVKAEIAFFGNPACNDIFDPGRVLGKRRAGGNGLDDSLPGRTHLGKPLDTRRGVAEKAAELSDQIVLFGIFGDALIGEDLAMCGQACP